MDRITAEICFDEIMFHDILGTSIGNIDELGEGYYARGVNGVQETDYIKYLEKLQSEGWIIISHTPNDIQHRVANATLKKKQNMIAITHNGYFQRIVITVYEKERESSNNIEESLCIIEANKMFAGQVEDCGAGNYVMSIENVAKNNYLTYLSKLDMLGFVKYAENEKGLFGFVFATTYIREKTVVTVTYIQKVKKLYISVCDNLPVSEHLLYDYKIKGNHMQDARTRLHMLEMYSSGNSFIFQLKNGRFIVSDGGTENEIGYLIDYLEHLVPANQKPIIEAWFISHAHRDHSGVLRAIAKNPDYAKRVWVEGIYYNEPGNNVVGLEASARVEISLIKEAAKVLKTTTGEEPKIYRPQTGQRYYFSDITIDILCAQEQLSVRDYAGDFNDSSTWCLFNIEGQRCLLGGDGDRAGIGFVMESYEKKDMKFDVFTLLHHGHNTRDRFTDFCDINTILVTAKGELPEYRAEENKHLMEVTKEWITWEDGTKVLTFPYELGQYECLPKNEWIYHRKTESDI